MSRSSDVGGQGLTSQRARDRMVERLAEQGVHDVRVLDAMRRVPRHVFVEPALAGRAYDDTALPIGAGQTISQPIVVGVMTQALLRFRPQRVLEVGTGCGYQTAVLAELGMQVHTVERIEDLLRGARRRLRGLGYDDIRSKHADGRLGWVDEGPYNAIVITAAGARLDPMLFDQLHDDGVLVAPIGSGSAQRLLVYSLEDDTWVPQDLGAVCFVPLLDGLS